MADVEGLGGQMPRVTTLLARGTEAGERGSPRPTGAREAFEPGGDDTVRITETAVHLRNLEARLASVPAVDSRRVEGVHQAISDGTYRIDPHRIAERLIAFEHGLGRATKPGEG